jgi:anti-sigma regulatory factor (Ser/Thr protein kinase)
MATGRPFGVEEVESEEHLSLEPVPSAVGRARAFVRSCLDDIEPDDRDAAVLMTSEFVTNAVLHARTRVSLCLARGADYVMVAVADDVNDQPVPKPRSTTRLGGRGLALVAELAVDWGTVTTVEGKVMWFSIPRRVPARKAG